MAAKMRNKILAVDPGSRTTGEDGLPIRVLEES